MTKKSLIREKFHKKVRYVANHLPKGWAKQCSKELDVNIIKCYNVAQAVYMNDEIFKWMLDRATERCNGLGIHFDLSEVDNPVETNAIIE